MRMSSMFQPKNGHCDCTCKQDMTKSLRVRPVLMRHLVHGLTPQPKVSKHFIEKLCKAVQHSFADQLAMPNLCGELLVLVQHQEDAHLTLHQPLSLPTVTQEPSTTQDITVAL